MSTVKTSFWNEFADAGDSPGLRSASVAEYLRAPWEEPKFIVPGLIRPARNTVVHVGGDCDCEMLAIILSAGIAVGTTIPPFGRTLWPQSPCLIPRNGFPELTRERITLVSEFFKGGVGHGRVLRGLDIVGHDQPNHAPPHLNRRSGQAHFLETIPEDCTITTFADVDSFMAPKEHASREQVSVDALLSALNQRGMATLCFVRRKKSGVATEDELTGGNGSIHVELTQDSEGPRDLGMAFKVCRTKVSEFDTVPLNFRFWYSTVGEKLDFGWEIPDPADTVSQKRVEIWERDRLIEKSAAEGIPYKDIATALGVHPSTVTRTMAKVRSEERIGRTTPADEGDDCA